MSGKSTNSKHGPKIKKIPVFSFPEELKFVVDDQSSHKQVLTLYNPYDFNVKFEVFSTAPMKYAVVESKGLIKTHCCVDIVVRHQMVGVSEEESCNKDKFRIDIFFNGHVIGRKLVPSTLIIAAGSLELKENSRDEKQINGDIATNFRTIQRKVSTHQVTAATPTAATPSPLGLLLMAFLCSLVLFIPLEGAEPLHGSSFAVNLKLAAAFALGLITMTILKS